MHPLLVALVVAVAIAFAVLIYWFMHTRGVKGSPIPESVDCAGATVTGHLDQNNSDTPSSFFARILNSAANTSTIPKSTWETWSVGSSVNPTGLPITFTLTGVGRDDMSSTILVSIWCKYDDGTSKQGEATLDCGGSGSPALLASRAAGNAPPRVTDTASMKYSVDLSGFGPELVTGVARACQLVYRGSVTGMLWDNGEDGTERLRVELMADRIYDADWRLTFRFRDIVISYVRSASDWQSLGVNIFHAVVPTSNAQAHFPETVRLVPA